MSPALIPRIFSGSFLTAEKKDLQDYFNVIYFFQKIKNSFKNAQQRVLHFKLFRVVARKKFLPGQYRKQTFIFICLMLSLLQKPEMNKWT